MLIGLPLGTWAGRVGSAAWRRAASQTFFFISTHALDICFVQYFELSCLNVLFFMHLGVPCDIADKSVDYIRNLRRIIHKLLHGTLWKTFRTQHIAWLKRFDSLITNEWDIYIMFGSHNGLSCDRYPVSICTHAEILLILPSETRFTEF